MNHRIFEKEKIQSLTKKELDANSKNVIYLGFPMRIYSKDEVDVVHGFWSWVPEFIPEPLIGHGYSFYVYKGSYIKGLWNWLKRRISLF